MNHRFRYSLDSIVFFFLSIRLNIYFETVLLSTWLRNKQFFVSHSLTKDLNADYSGQNNLN